MNKELTLSNGNSIYVDFFDLDFREAYAKNAKEYGEKMKSINLENDEIEVLKEQYAFTEGFIDTVFGTGELLRLLNGKKDLSVMLELIVALTNHKTESDKHLNEYAKQVKF